ncbi:MAG: ribonuclease Z [Desulfobulbaceae bacterium]|nr:ribonuclease Z [Desulfobulbaceae bacterium]
MDVFFIGVGDACDPQHGNTSILVKTGNGVNILFDCGFSVPHSYFAFTGDPDQLDIIWISHFHGDHFFGLPLLILRLWEMGRSKPLLITGPRGLSDKILTAMDLAYPSFRSKFCYALQFLEIEPDNAHSISGLTCQSVQTDHSQRNLGILVEDGDKKLYYSGDGRPTRQVPELIKNCDLAVHEAYMLDEEVHHHGSVSGCLKLAEESCIRQLALVHLNMAFRRVESAHIGKILDANPAAILPEAGLRITV